MCEKIKSNNGNKIFSLLVKFTTPAHNIGTRDEYEMSSFRVSL